MKITHELKIAIRAVMTKKNQHHRTIDGPALKKEAVRKFLHSHKAPAALVKKVWDAKKALHALEENLGEKYGLEVNGSGETYIGRFGQREQKFVAAGGVMPDLEEPNAENFIARLAMATPTEGDKLLKSIGINWT